MVVKNKSTINLAGIFVSLAAALEREYLDAGKEDLRMLINNAALNEVVAKEAVTRLLNELDSDQTEALLHRYEAITNELNTSVVSSAVEMAELVNETKTKSSDGIKD